MNKSIRRLTVCLAVLAISAAALGQSAEIRLRDGSKWRGKVADQVELTHLQQGVEVSLAGKLIKVEELFIVVEGKIAGRVQAKTIFKSDIASMKSVSGDAPAATPPTVKTPEATAKEQDTSASKANAGQAPAKAADGRPLGVFVLPLKGTVGEGMRHNEIEAVAKEADKFGPGQIIVLEIESPGGLLIEVEKIHQTLTEVRKRHRVVAWIKEAISCAASTAINCNEIYFTQTGTLGAMTAFSGLTALQGEALQQWLDMNAKRMQAGDRNPYIAYAMIDEKAMLSYDKDPVTGKVTWYNDLSGEFDLSDEKTNLVFTASTALHSGFADGVANTEEDLAKLLDLPEWRELSDVGRRKSKEWLDTVEKAKQEIPLIAARLNYEGAGSGDQTVVLGKRIQNFEALIKWWDRCPNVCFLTGVPPKEELERQVVELRRQLSRMNR